VRYWTVEKQNYDFMSATEKSRLHIQVGIGTMMTGEFKASRENCDHLKTVFLNHIIPNMQD